MNRAVRMLPALCATTLLAGCGSSGSSGAGSTSAATASTPTSTVSTVGSPRFDKTPRYASPTSAAPLHSGLVNVAYHFITIQPDVLRVKVGSTIRWSNDDTVEHNVTSQSGPQSFASKNFGKGGTFEIKANKPGVIHYLCTIHPTSMNGTIEVLK